MMVLSRVEQKKVGGVVGRRKVSSRVVRVTMPTDAIEGFEQLAKKLHMDVGMTIRFCASLQLAQFETTVMKPNVTESDEHRQQRATTAAEGYLPEVLKPEPEPEPRFGFKPRGELDEPEPWVPTQGYMAGL
jgi:hypothetical protein